LLPKTPKPLGELIISKSNDSVASTAKLAQRPGDPGIQSETSRKLLDGPTKLLQETGQAGSSGRSFA